MEGASARQTHRTEERARPGGFGATPSVARALSSQSAATAADTKASQVAGATPSEFTAGFSEMWSSGIAQATPPSPPIDTQSCVTGVPPSEGGSATLGAVVEDILPRLAMLVIQLYGLAPSFMDMSDNIQKLAVCQERQRNDVETLRGDLLHTNGRLSELKAGLCAHIDCLHRPQSTTEGHCDSGAESAFDRRPGTGGALHEERAG